MNKFFIVVEHANEERVKRILSAFDFKANAIVVLFVSSISGDDFLFYIETTLDTFALNNIKGMRVLYTPIIKTFEMETRKEE